MGGKPSSKTGKTAIVGSDSRSFFLREPICQVEFEEMAGAHSEAWGHPYVIEQTPVDAVVHTRGGGTTQLPYVGARFDYHAITSPDSFWHMMQVGACANSIPVF